MEVLGQRPYYHFAYYSLICSSLTMTNQDELPRFGDRRSNREDSRWKRHAVVLEKTQDGEVINR